MSAVDFAGLAATIENRHGMTLDVDSSTPVSGGSIASAYRVESATGPLFLKLGPKAQLPMFEAEADGLAALEEAGHLRVPRELGFGESSNTAYLLLTWLSLRPPGVHTQAALGKGLAQQHRVLGSTHGWRRDNFIGATPQLNGPENHWLDFLRKRRFDPQLELALRNGFGGALQDRGQALLNNLEDLFDLMPAPSLLHGDLWGGNWGADEQGAPWVFDPAVYYGDRETDLAMTRLFGGFGADFYRAYQQEWPLPTGWQRRQALYQLYHVLNHLNLFGAGYLGHAGQLLDELGV